MSRLQQEWLRSFAPRPFAERRLICFPHAGGAASFYRRWAAELPADVDLWIVQYPAREDRINDALPGSLEAMAELIARALSALDELPTTLFGHSMGATVAYETARCLQRSASRWLGRVVVSARPAPRQSRASGVAAYDDGALVRELQRLGGTNTCVLSNEALLALILPAVRGDYELIDQHARAQGGVAVSGERVLRQPLLALAAADDSEASLEEVRGWSEYTCADFELRTFAGGHFYFHDRLPELLKAILPRAGGRSTVELWPSTP